MSDIGIGHNSAGAVLDLDSEEAERNRIIQSMTYVIEGLRTGVWGVVSGYIEHPVIASEIMQGAVSLYLHSLLVYHDKETGAKYAQKMMDLVAPFAEQQVEADEDDWFDMIAPPLLEKLG
jgi:hypothetical protein